MGSFHLRHTYLELVRTEGLILTFLLLFSNYYKVNVLKNVWKVKRSLDPLFSCIFCVIFFSNFFLKYLLSINCYCFFLASSALTFDNVMRAAALSLGPKCSCRSCLSLRTLSYFFFALNSYMAIGKYFWVKIRNLYCSINYLKLMFASNLHFKLASLDDFTYFFW